MINRKSIVNSPDDRLRQFNRMPIPNTHTHTPHFNAPSHSDPLSQMNILSLSVPFPSSLLRLQAMCM